MASPAASFNPVLGGRDITPSWSYSLPATCFASPAPKDQFGSLGCNMMPTTPPASPDTIPQENSTSINSVQSSSTIHNSSDPNNSTLVPQPQDSDSQSSIGGFPEQKETEDFDHDTSETIMCYVCDAEVNREHFKQHLFFGSMQCTKCGHTWNECKEFASTQFVNTGCHHALKFENDPFKFIISKVSGDFNYEALSEPNDTLSNLTKYLKILCTDILPHKSPLNDAIQKCTDNLTDVSCTPVNFNTSTNNISEEAFNDDSNFGTSDCSSLTKSPLCCEREGLNKNQDTGSKEIYDERISDVDDDDSDSQTNSTDASEHVLLQAYDLEALDQTIEYVEVTSNLNAENTVFSESTQVLRSTKTPKVKEKELNPFVSLPGNGNYLISDKSLEECPMCYTTLRPSRFRVNVESFLVTTVCTGCDLRIYFVVSSSVSIVNDADKVTLSQIPIQPPKKKRSTKRTSQPRRSIRASDFFAK